MPTSLICHTWRRSGEVSLSASEETESSAAVTMPCRPVDHCLVDTDDPLLPVRRHKRRRAAATDDTVQTSDVEPRRAFTERRTHSDSEPHSYESVTTADQFRSLSASAAHLSHQDTAMTSLHWTNDVTVTSSAAVVTESVGMTSCEPAMTATCDQRPESPHRTTSALYCQPRKQEDMTSATMTRRRSSDDVRLSRSSAHTSTRPTSIDITTCRQPAVTDYDDTVTSSDYYEPVDYSHSHVTSMSPCESYPQQSRSKQQVDNLVYMGLQGFLYN